jgi:hypothetical protein
VVVADLVVVVGSSSAFMCLHGACCCTSALLDMLALLGMSLYTKGRAQSLYAPCMHQPCLRLVCLQVFADLRKVGGAFSCNGGTWIGVPEPA